MKSNITLYFENNHDPVNIFNIKRVCLLHPDVKVFFKNHYNNDDWKEFIKSFRLYYKDKLFNEKIDIPENYVGFILTYSDTDNNEHILTDIKDILTFIEQ